jgi:hypothetical protein
MAGLLCALARSTAQPLNREIDLLVQKFNADDDVLIIPLRVSLRDGFQNLKGLLHGVAGLPLWWLHELARVVVPVLRSGRTVEVDDDLQS